MGPPVIHRVFYGQAVELCGRRWREVAKQVPSRSDKQCRERFCNVLDPDLKREDEWTPEEDTALRAAIAQHTTQPGNKVRCAAPAAVLVRSRGLILA